VVKLKLLKAYAIGVLGVMRIRMIVDVLIDDVVGDISTRSTEIASGPEMPTPVALSQLRKFLLHLARRTSFGLLDELTDGHVRRN